MAQSPFPLYRNGWTTNNIQAMLRGSMRAPTSCTMMTATVDGIIARSQPGGGASRSQVSLRLTVHDHPIRHWPITRPPLSLHRHGTLGRQSAGKTTAPCKKVTGEVTRLTPRCTPPPKYQPHTTHNEPDTQRARHTTSQTHNEPDTQRRSLETCRLPAHR